MPDRISTDLELSEDFEVRKQAVEELFRQIRKTPVAVREALETYQPVTDADQKSVVEATERTIRVLAPAGSGKTQTVINRTLHRIRQGVHPDRILILTFDNAAAMSLRNKLSVALHGLGNPRAGVEISTLNAYGYRLLRNHVPDEYRRIVHPTRRNRIIGELRQALREKDSSVAAAIPAIIQNRFIADFFSRLKNETFDPDHLESQKFVDYVLKLREAQPFFESTTTGDVKKTLQALIWMFRGYQRLLDRDEQMDFDDQKLRAHRALSASEDLLRTVQGQISEVVVDEFQDINLLDFNLIRLISDRADLVVTGDDDQAIYGFRGCSPTFIIELEKHLGREVASYELRRNYRCPAAIVAHANRLIRNNTWRVDKSPIPMVHTDSEIKVVSSLSSALEAKSVVELIRRVRSASPAVQYGDFGILYRTNAQSLPLQIEMLLSDVPFRVREEDDILRNEVLEKLIGVLRVKRDVVAGSRVSARDLVLTVRAYFRFLAPAVESRVREQIERSSNRGLASLQTPEIHALLPKLRESNFEEAAAEVLRAEGLIRTLDVLAKKFKGLRGMLGSLEDVVEERVPLGEIYEVALGFQGDIGSFIDTIEEAIRKAGRLAEQDESADCVDLRTYFRAKGLQWHTVILTSCNEGLIPHRKAPVEDERRLFTSA